MVIKVFRYNEFYYGLHNPEHIKKKFFTASNIFLYFQEDKTHIKTHCFFQVGDVNNKLLDQILTI